MTYDFMETASNTKERVAIEDSTRDRGENARYPIVVKVISREKCRFLATL
jgi:hypothetical protein